MVDYRAVLVGRMNVLKTDYVTANENIKRAVKDVAEAKLAAEKMLGGILYLELVLAEIDRAARIEVAQVVPDVPVKVKVDVALVAPVVASLPPLRRTPRLKK